MKLFNQRSATRVIQTLGIFGATTALTIVGSSPFNLTHHSSANSASAQSAPESPSTPRQGTPETQPGMEGAPDTQGTPGTPRTPTTPTQGTPNRQGNVTEVDRLFVMEAARGGMAEVRMAQMALQKTKNAQVRQYAQQMIQDHTPANQQLMQLAQQKGITPPTDLGKYQVVMTRLAQLSGNEFDRAYMSEAGMNGHMENLAVHRRQAELGQDAELKAYAVRVLPVVQKHLQQITQMGTSGSSR